MHARRAATLVVVVALAGLAGPALAAKKVFLNPSDQTGNAVVGGGNEAQYAEIVANLAAELLRKAGFEVKITAGLSPATSNANSWGADIFVSLHTNAGGGHGTESLYVSSGGKALAAKINAGLVGKLGYFDRGLKPRSDLHVLNVSKMYATLAEALFHDCGKTSGEKAHPPAEAALLRSKEGQQKIAAGYADGVCAYFGQQCEPEPPPPPATGSLKGTVFRAPNMDDVLPGAEVKAGDKQAVTSDTGQFELALPPGTYEVTATAEGYRSGSVEAQVVAGEEIWASIGLVAEQVDAGVSREDAGVGLDVRRAPVEDGCGCQAAAPARGTWLLALLAAALLCRRRRRS